MKRLGIVTAFIALIFCGITTATAQNKNTNPQITKFVEQYFPEANVVFVDSEWDEYEVRLSDGTQVEFNKTPEWKKVDCEHSNVYNSVPAALVPDEIATYVKTNFGGQSIIKIEKKRRGWEVELNSELEIKFDSRFNVTKIDD